MKIAMAGDLSARLFAVPFLLLGGYLIYQLVGGIADLLTGRAAITEMLAGMLLLLIVALAFVVPGWLLMFSRARIEIDRTARVVTSVRDFGIYQQREAHPLSRFEGVKVDLLSVAPNRHSKGRRAFQVELSDHRGTSLLVGVFGAHDDALSFGRRVANFIDVSFDDLRFRPDDAETRGE
jgi:hypothetical protein